LDATRRCVLWHLLVFENQKGPFFELGTEKKTDTCTNYLAMTLVPGKSSARSTAKKNVQLTPGETQLVSPSAISFLNDSSWLRH